MRAFGILLSGVTLLLAACTGLIEEPGGGGSPSGGSTSAAAKDALVSGMRRLTAAEYDATIHDLLGIDVESATSLPFDERAPFDNDIQQQVASDALVASMDVLAGSLAAQVVGAAALRSKVVPCSPAGADDSACFGQFLETFGRRALRRPLTADELTRYSSTLMAHGKLEGDFWVSVDSALRLFLTHPAFMYRIELGTPVSGKPGVFRLSDFELATRLSYTLWGSTPPDWLLDAAEQGELSSESGVRVAAEKLFDSERAKAQVARFHALWLGYEEIKQAPELAADLRAETAALLERVIFEQRRPWTDVLLSDETFVTPALADHYGLPAPSGGAGWVSYGSTGRRGLLSHGSFLSAGDKFGDTSPTQRGLLIRTRLFCQKFGLPPPELMVNTDMPPQAADPNACKSERYTMWKTDGCSKCHSQLEPVGFGLENYDSAGRYRTHEKDRPDCPIDGEGELPGIGSFANPAELAGLLVDTGAIDECVAVHLLRFTMGRYDLDDRDAAFVTDQVAKSSPDGGVEFRELVLAMVTAPAFRMRRDEEKVAP